MKKLTPEDIERIEKETRKLLKKNKRDCKTLRLRVRSEMGRTGNLPDFDDESKKPGAA